MGAALGVDLMTLYLRSSWDGVADVLKISDDGNLKYNSRAMPAVTNCYKNVTITVIFIANVSYVQSPMA